MSSGLPTEATTPSIEPERPRGPYGGWATVALGFVVVAVFLAVQVAVTLVFVAIEFAGSGDDFGETAESFANDGTLLSVATIFTTIVCGALVLALIAARRGPSVREYLALGVPRPRAILPWLGVTILFVVVSDFLTRGLDREIVHEFMVEAVSSADSLALIVVALVLGAPLFEELLFRGFLLEGLRKSAPGTGGAVLLTSGSFALMHLPQYGVYEVGTIFALGVVLAIARLRTQSLWTPIVMHGLINAVATAETLYVLRQAD